MMKFYVIVVIIILFVEVEASQLRSFNNPLNGKSIDIFFVVDESNSKITNINFERLKTALKSIATELNPVGGSPCFGVYFFGATSSVRSIAPFPTCSITLLNTYLGQIQRAMAQPNPSSLVSALTSIESSCSISCRSNAPRVTIVFSHDPAPSAELAIRQLENNSGMTMMVVGIGSKATETIVEQLASYPPQYYAIHVASELELISTAQPIASFASNVPRLLGINQPLHTPSTSSAAYYTVQLNLLPYTKMNNKIIMFASNCPSCKVFGSLTEPNPVSDNTNQNANMRPFFAYSGYPNSKYYFRVPQNASRLF
ncbi:unnamed protein product, partial [Rotaria sp. Silwood2]